MYGFETEDELVTVHSTATPMPSSFLFYAYFLGWDKRRSKNPA
jgi:hypothetical protein